jgi:sulfur-oxidizing protein SoxA
MLGKLIKTSIIALTLSGVLYASSFNAQAEKDRKAFVNYFIKKFQDPVSNQAKYFPNIKVSEIKKDYRYPLSFQDFQDGSLAWYKPSRQQFKDINEFPPYSIAVDDGEALWNKPFANGKTYSSCFAKPGVRNDYPYFDTKTNQVVTIGQAVNACRVKNGEKPYKYGKGNIAKVIAYMAVKSRGKKIHVTIPSMAAAKAYEDGKRTFYKQRGFLSLSCNECHVKSAGKRIRAESLSPALGQTTEMPVFRVKGGGTLVTLQGRLVGCVKGTGAEKPKPQSKMLRNLSYFLTYMSNGMKLYGPDTRK